MMPILLQALFNLFRKQHWKIQFKSGAANSQSLGPVQYILAIEHISLLQIHRNEQEIFHGHTTFVNMLRAMMSLKVGIGN